LKVGLWFRRGRLFMVSPVRGDHRRFQAETPLNDLFKFAEPALTLRIPFWEQIRFKASFGEAVLGVMDRLVLNDAAWERMAPLIIGRPDQKGSTGRDNRMFVEGVLWIVRTGSPWRDLPEAFRDWNSVFRRFSRWSIKGVWWRIFEAMSDDPDFEYLIVDSTIVRAHQHAAGAKKGGLKIRRSVARAVA
jgi:putative transposase